MGTIVNFRKVYSAKEENDSMKQKARIFSEKLRIYASI